MHATPSTRNNELATARGKFPDRSVTVQRISTTENILVLRCFSRKGLAFDYGGSTVAIASCQPIRAKRNFLPPSPSSRFVTGISRRRRANAVYSVSLFIEPRHLLFRLG